MNHQTQLASYHFVFFDDTYVSEAVFVDFDKPPIFDEDVFEKVQYEGNSYFVDCFHKSHVKTCIQFKDCLRFQTVKKSHYIWQQRVGKQNWKITGK